MPNFSSIRTVLAGAVLLAGCREAAVAPADNTPHLRPLSAAERQTVGSANDFAYRAFGALRRGAPADNLCISPLSVSAALTMAYNGAAGSTKAAMKQTLGFQSQTDLEINQSFQSLFALLRGLDNRVAFAAANSLWYNQQYQLQAPFVQQNQTYFGATVQGLKFGEPAAADAINNWVAANTEGKIPRIVDNTSGADVLYLVNAIYFKGAWTYRFDPQRTRPEPFRAEDGRVRDVDFMTLPGGRYLYYHDAQQQVIDLPYGNRQFSMTFVVPQGSATLADVAARLSGPQLATWLAAADSTGAELHLPKFRLDYAKDLNETLTQLGMAVAFGGQANFSAMLAGGGPPLQISQVKHKTFLEVNEEGTEAAAATAVGIAVSYAGPPPVVRLDRPFFFLIREKSSNAVLFIGQLTNP